MTRFETIFFDVGGVCLTNGWDTSARRSAALHFSLDLEEFEERHQALVDALERDEQSLDGYLDPVVFHQHRSFSHEGGEENVEGARALGIHAIHVTDLPALTEQLIHAGVEVPMSGPVSARMDGNLGDDPRRDETAAREE